MTDFTPLVRDAFQDDSLPAADRDRLWNIMEHRHARQTRRKLLVRAGLLLLAGLLLAAWAFLRMSPVPPSPMAMHADSISTDSPVRHSMTQEPRHEVQSNLMPLLDHRSSIMNDLEDLEERQLELAAHLKQTSGREHDVVMGQLASLEQQIESSRIALRVLDAQMAGQPMSVPVISTSIEPPQVITVSGGLSDELIWSSGGIGLLLVLAMLGMVIYMRRIARLTRDALTAVERQVSSQHATLASGIDAIAVEVERLGEGQRFMSKVLSGSEAKAAPVSRT